MENDLELTRCDIREIKGEVSALTYKLSEIHSALMGNNMTKDGGLIQRVIDGESELVLLKTKITDIEKRKDKSELYVRIIWGTGGGILMTIFALIIEHLFKA